MSVQQIRIADFDYHLPAARIATHPLAERDACRLLVGRRGEMSHHLFGELPELLPGNALLVRNNTRVIHARLHFRKPTGADIEIFLLEPEVPADYVSSFESRTHCQWSCLAGNFKKWKEGSISLTVDVNGTPATVYAEKANPGPARADGSLSVIFSWNADASFAEIVERAGSIPIPPYLNRESEESDLTDYQTTYACVQGSVAAPTAGLHFTPDTFLQLRDKGIEIADLTLHVGAGTFKPVKSDDIGGHDMHTETFTVTRTMLRQLIHALEEERPIVAVGTTSVRTLESLPRLAVNVACGKGWHVEQWQAYAEDAPSRESTIALLSTLLDTMNKAGMECTTASTAIMIAPGFGWKIVSGMVTNFHQPRSTLLLLVSSFLGGNLWRYIYAEALRRNYRFLSYGDACLFLK